MMDEIAVEIDRQSQRIAFAYQKRAQADEEIKEAEHIIQALEWAKQNADAEA